MAARMRTMGLGGAVIVVATALGACGDDDATSSSMSTSPTGTSVPGGEGEPGERAYVDAFVAGFQQDGDDDVVITSEQAACLGPRFVDVLGVERLRDADVTPDQVASGVDLDFAALGLEEGEGEELYDAFGACDLDLRELLLFGVASGDGPVDETQACVDDAVSDSMVRAFFVASVVRGAEAAQTDPAVEALQSALDSCLSSTVASTPATTG